MPCKADGVAITEMPSGWSAHVPGDDTAHFLNATSAFILELCDGMHDHTSIAHALQGAFGLPEPPVDDVRQFLGQARSAGLIQ